MKNRKKTLLILIILTIAFIWFQSALPPKVSDDESIAFLENFIKPVLKAILGKEPAIDNHIIRKCAHVFEFMVLGVLFASFKAFPIASDEKQRATRIVHYVLSCLAFCAFFAFLDETIQIFSGRNPQISDVWIDSIGILLGISLSLIFKSLKSSQ